MVLGLVEGPEIKARVSIATQSFLGPEKVIQRLLAAVEDMIRQARPLTIAGMGLAAPGVMDRCHKSIVYSPNLNWHNIPLVDILQAKLRVPVWMENDADLYALGEYVNGQGQNMYDLICITLGTGVGGGIICNGKIMQGQSGWTSELGHAIVQPGGMLCGCGNRGCLEAYASATGMQNLLRAALAAGQASVLRPDDGVKAMEDAARQKDAVALTVFQQASQALSIGIINAVLITGIEKIVLGGGVAKGWPLMREFVWQSVRDNLKIIDWRKLTIEISQLGNDAPLLGAAALVKDNLNI